MTSSETNSDFLGEEKPADSDPGSDGESSDSSGGRPPKPESERRSHTHGLRLSPNEKDELERRAEAAGLSMSELLRRRALGKPIQPKAARTSRRRLARLALEIEELADIAEEDGELSSELEQELAETLGEIKGAIETLMEGTD
jgi:hypothetical protein